MSQTIVMLGAMTAWDVDRHVAALARRQHGAFSAAQARAGGATSRMIRRRVASERWIELDKHVYALDGNPSTWQRQCMAATLVIDQAAVSHASAAVLHSLEGFRPGRIHIVVPPATNHRTRLATVHETTWARHTHAGNIRVVTLADTLYQLTGVVPAARFKTVFGNAVVADQALLPQLVERYVDVAHMRLPGIGVMRTLLVQYDGTEVPPQTELEHLLDTLLDQVDDLPQRHRQAPLPGWDAGVARVDVMIPDWNLIVEADGRRWHTRVDDFERDRWRDNVATAHGFDVLRFTYRQLTAGASRALAVLDRYAAGRRLAA